MDLDSVFKKIAQEITAIQQQKSNHQRLAKQSFEQTNRTIEKIKESKGKIDDFTSAENMSFLDINGERKFYGHSTQTFEDLKQNQIHLYKLQLQWLLVNAYEYFEIYLKNLYALCWNNENIWKLKHFGSLTRQEVNELSTERIKELAFKVEPNEILNIFRNKIPNISSLETNNKLGVDLKFFMKIIEKIRHIVVHNNGYIRNMNKFQEKVFKELGYAQNSDKAKELTGSFLLLVDEDHFIDLRKLVDRKHKYLPMEYCRFSILIEKMMCYADLLRLEIQNQLNEK